MPRTLIAITLTLGLALISVFAVQSASSARPSKVSAPDSPVLIELFTSQGCSSCPPADKLAQRLNREENLVVISRPVDYWDRLGWKDTFALEENTDLQFTYYDRGLAGNNGVYTPQTVVAGAMGEVGSRETALRRMIARASSGAQAAIRVRGDSERGFAIGLAGDTDSAAQLVLVGVDRHAKVAIGRGENRGKSVGYTNVFKDDRVLASWSGGKASHVIEAEALAIEGADRYAVILREPQGGRVLAARWLDQNSLISAAKAAAPRTTPTHARHTGSLTFPKARLPSQLPKSTSGNSDKPRTTVRHSSTPIAAPDPMPAIAAIPKMPIIEALAVMRAMSRPT